MAAKPARKPRRKPRHACGAAENGGYVQAHRVFLVRADFGHTVEICRRKETGEEVRLSLGSVLDLSYSHALELHDALVAFLAKQPVISLNNRRALKRQIETHRTSAATHRVLAKKAEQRAKELAACLKTAPK